MLKPVAAFAAAAIVLAVTVPRMAPSLFASPALLADRSAPSPTRQGKPGTTAATIPGTKAGTAYVRSDRSGHFVSTIEVQGRALQAVLDTGATSVALRYEDARDLGLLQRERFDRAISTANGMGRGMAVRLNEVRIGGVVVYDVEAMVLQPGALSTNLLGMSFLRRLSRFEVRSDVVVLEQ